MAASQLSVGDVVYALNPKYSDGTRLRSGPSHDAAFNGVWVPNDMAVTVVEAPEDGSGFVLVRKSTLQTGWIQARNLSQLQRVPGARKDAPSLEVVTPDPEYVRGIRIFGEAPTWGRWGRGGGGVGCPVALTFRYEFLVATAIMVPVATLTAHCTLRPLTALVVWEGQRDGGGARL